MSARPQLPAVEIIPSEGIELFHEERLADSAAFDFALAAHVALRAEGKSDVLLPSLDAQVVSAWDGERCVGAFVWSEDAEASLWWTEVGYVDPAYRRRGIYRALWWVVVELARQAGVRRIDGGAAVGNAEMAATMAALGRAPAYVVYRYDL